MLSIALGGLVVTVNSFNFAPNKRTKQIPRIVDFRVFFKMSSGFENIMIPTVETAAVSPSVYYNLKYKKVLKCAYN